MSKSSCVLCVLLTLAVCLGAAQTQAPGPKKQVGKGPDFGFDYRAFIIEHQALITSGEAEKATEYLHKHSKFPKLFAPIEANLRKGFSAIYGAAGEYRGHEFVGYKRLGSKIFQFYLIANYEKVTILHNYVFEHYDGEWKWVSIGTMDNFDEMMKVFPLHPIDDK